MTNQADIERLVERLRAVESSTLNMSDSVTTCWHRNPDGPEAADTITALQARIAELEGAATAFLAKYDECAPHVTDAFLHRQLRCGPYTGPQLGEELASLRAAARFLQSSDKGGEG